jgi:hypothetical protein
LKANADQSFQGSIVLGLGFTMPEAEAKAFIERDPKNGEVLFPYLNGDDLNSHPEQKPSRWVINFWDWPLDRDAEGSWITATEQQKNQYFNIGHAPSDYPGRVVMDFPELFAWLDEKVRPERQRLNKKGEYALRRPLPIRWWQYADKRPTLYHAIGRGASFAKHPENWDKDCVCCNVIAVSLVQTYLKFEHVSNNSIFAHKLAIILPDFGRFGVLSSSVFQEWARKTSSTMGYGINFSPSDSYETFPFPEKLEVLSGIGRGFELARKTAMQELNVGLTELYNIFHNSARCSKSIEGLRAIQMELDQTLLHTYGWNDIPLEHDFYPMSYLSPRDNIRYTISEPARIEVLRRLAILNKQRWQEEQEAEDVRK